MATKTHTIRAIPSERERVISALRFEYRCAVRDLEDILRTYVRPHGVRDFKYRPGPRDLMLVDKVLDLPERDTRPVYVYGHGGYQVGPDGLPVRFTKPNRIGPDVSQTAIATALERINIRIADLKVRAAAHGVRLV